MTAQSKVYSGKRGRFINAVEVRERGSLITRPLELRLDLFNDSPTRFEWGYGGSGPAQLALAILADHLGDGAAAVCRHQVFKWSVVAKLDSAEWRLSPREIYRWHGGGAQAPTLDKMRRAMGAGTFVTLASIQIPLRPLTRA
jgi:hypothetical protein